MPRLRESTASAGITSPASRNPITPPTSRSTGARGAASQNTALPPYQPPTHPLTADARNKVAMILNEHPSQRLNALLKNAANGLTTQVDEVNQLARESNEAYERRSARRARDGEEPDGQDLENVQRLKEKVENMTGRMEVSVRKCIDAQKKIENVDKSLREIQGNVERSATQATQATAAVTEDGEETAENNTQGYEALMTSFDEKLEKYNEAYLAKPPKLRYQQHPWFRNFKETEYHAIHGDEAKRPDPNSWFDSDGAPRPGETGGTDEDFEEVGERISTKCPITLMDFVEPVTSKKCPHSFERSEIIKMINNARAPQRARSANWVQTVCCPIGGCQSRLGLDDLEDNIRLKTLVKRKQRRQELARQQAEEDEEDGAQDVRSGRHVEEVESDDEDENNEAERRPEPSSAPAIKRERMRRADMDVIEDDSDG